MDKFFYIGLMSGTSIDAVDAVLVSFQDGRFKFLWGHSNPISPEIKHAILALCHSTPDEIDRLGELDIQLGELFAETCLQLLIKSGVHSEQILAIGSHGQTIRHCPSAKIPFTLQIGCPHTIAARTGITVIADFRRRDMVFGGQVAPLVPGFHAYLLQNTQRSCWILNIGGIANLTWLPAHSKGSILGFDSGPGNTLLDAWYLQNTGDAYDKEGAWAAKGRISKPLLASLLADPYFSKKSPKSTGREHFNLNWLNQHVLSNHSYDLDAKDVQSTLLELTAVSITQAIIAHSKDSDQLFVCGGGVKNIALMHRLRQLSPYLTIESTESAGIDPQWMEASAFAWLAHQTLNNQPSNLPSVTGASHATILGAIYPTFYFDNSQ